MMFFTVNKFEDKVKSLTDKIAEKANQEDLNKAVECLQKQLDNLKAKIYKYKLHEIVITNVSHRPFLIKKLIDNDSESLYRGNFINIKDLQSIISIKFMVPKELEHYYKESSDDLFITNDDVHEFKGVSEYALELYEAWVKGK